MREPLFYILNFKTLARTTDMGLVIKMITP